jgi:hypothetical protein
MSNRPVEPPTSGLAAPNSPVSAAAGLSSASRTAHSRGEKAAAHTGSAAQSASWYEHMRLAAYFPNDPDTLEAG